MPFYREEYEYDSHFFSFLFLGGVFLMRENKFQSELKKELREMFPGCIVMKLDPTDIQGIPDLLILYNDRWAALECKRASDAHRRPNQEYYIHLMNRMSFASFIEPENKEEVLYELEKTLKRPLRVKRNSFNS